MNAAWAIPFWGLFLFLEYRAISIYRRKPDEMTRLLGFIPVHARLALICNMLISVPCVMAVVVFVTAWLMVGPAGWGVILFCLAVYGVYRWVRGGYKNQRYRA